MAAKLGSPVVFRAEEKHLTKTDKGEKKGISGSVFHHELVEFAGQIGRVHKNGSADIIIFVPNQAARWVEGVKEGTTPGTFSQV